jgi:hypothetical protein
MEHKPKAELIQINHPSADKNQKEAEPENMTGLGIPIDIRND